jgi:hypothetical protein
MNKQELQTLLQSFCTTDTFRTSLRTPMAYKYPNKEYIFATDGIQLIGVPAALLPDHEYDCYQDLEAEGKKYMADYGSVINPSMFADAPQWVLPFDQIDAVVTEIQQIPEYKDKYKDCNECNGEGRIECTCCGQDMDCDECDGEGEIICGRDETGNYRYPEDVKFLIKDSYFSIERMAKFVSMLKPLGINSVLVHRVEGNKPMLLSNAETDIIFLIMPLHNEYIEHSKINVINLVPNA